MKIAEGNFAARQGDQFSRAVDPGGDVMRPNLKGLDLFSGIGMFALGLHRAGGFRTVAFCEIEPFPRAVLARHWPEVPCYADVTQLTAARLAADGIVPDVICGGFPCQDLSVAGKGAGLDGERSGLWREYARLIEEIRPRYVIIENVPPLRTRGLDQVLGRLASLGYDAEWHCIPASALGAPHRRDRVWIVAYATRDGGRWPRVGVVDGGAGGGWVVELGTHRSEARDVAADVAYPDRARREGLGLVERRQGRENTEIAGAGSRGDVANAEIGGWREHGDERGQVGDAHPGQPADCGETLAYAEHGGREGRNAVGVGAEPALSCRAEREPIVSAADIRRSASERRWRRVEPGMGGKTDGHPAGLDGPRRLEARPVEPWEGNTPRTVGRGSPNRRPRLKALGNTADPAIIEMIGRAILRADAKEHDQACPHSSSQHNTSPETTQ